jgi:hypothetical protein
MSEGQAEFEGWSRQSFAPGPLHVEVAGGCSLICNEGGVNAVSRRGQIGFRDVREARRVMAGLLAVELVRERCRVPRPPASVAWQPEHPNSRVQQEWEAEHTVVVDGLCEQGR